MSIRTEEAYVYWVKRFILFHGKRHPNELAAPDVEIFLVENADSITIFIDENVKIKNAQFRSISRYS